MGPRHNLSFCACKRAWFELEILVSTGTSLHLWFLHSKHRILVQNYKSLRFPDFTNRFVLAKRRDLHQNDKSILVPDLICGFCMQNSDFWSRITNLYGSQPWSVVLWVQKCDFRGRIACLYGYQNSPAILWMKKSVISFRNTSLYWSQPSSVVFGSKTATFGPE